MMTSRSKNRFYRAFDTERLPDSGPNVKSEGEHRSDFQVDRDRIIFSQAFRRLQSKTQVFQSGDYDFYRTRLTHSIEVARIGRSICEYLLQTSPHLEHDFYIDPDLVEAVGLAHDIGHPPFGHIGERKLHALMHDWGCFEGNAQTLRIVTERFYERYEAPAGMRPTRAFLDGVLKYKMLLSEAIGPDGTPPHHHFLYEDQKLIRDFVFPDGPGDQPWANLRSIECAIMDWADDTAYSLHDILDGIKAGFINRERLERWAEGKALDVPASHHLENLLKAMRRDAVEPIFSAKIGAFLRACQLVHTPENPLAGLSHRHAFGLKINPAIAEECSLYKQIALELIFQSPRIQQIEFKGGIILERLFHAMVENYGPGIESGLRILPQQMSRWVQNRHEPAARMRELCDCLAEMTDPLAIRTYRRLFEADFGSITDLA